jgi:hypothetical protein
VPPVAGAWQAASPGIVDARHQPCESPASTLAMARWPVSEHGAAASLAACCSHALGPREATGSDKLRTVEEQDVE